MISETETGASDADISAHNGDQTTAANSRANSAANSANSANSDGK